MPEFSISQRRRALYVVEPKQEYFTRLNDAIASAGLGGLQRTYREQGFWTVQKRIAPLVR